MGEKTTPCKTDYRNEDLEKNIEDKNEELDRFFLYSNGNTEYLISTYHFEEIEKCQTCKIDGLKNCNYCEKYDSNECKLF